MNQVRLVRTVRMMLLNMTRLSQRQRKVQRVISRKEAKMEKPFLTRISKRKPMALIRKLAHLTKMLLNPPTSSKRLAKAVLVKRIGVQKALARDVTLSLSVGKLTDRKPLMKKRKIGHLKDCLLLRV